MGDKAGETGAVFLMGWISREPFFHHSDSTQNNLNGAAGELTNTPFTGLLIPVGDRFTLSAANGGITSIAAVEIRAENLFGLAVKRTLIVTGG